VRGRQATAREAAMLHAARVARTEAAGWDDVTTARLRVLWDEGLSASACGAQLQKSKNSIIGKAHRLHLPPRPCPIIRKNPVAHVKRADMPMRPPAVTLPPLASVSMDVAPPPPPPEPPPEPTADVSVPPPALQPVPLALRVRRASDAPCCWPTTVNGRHRMLCEAPAEGRGSYCAAHAAQSRAGVQMRPKQQAKLAAAHG